MSESQDDSVVSVTRKSWFARVGESLVGVLLGFALIPVSVVVLWWNEGRAVQTARSLAEGAAQVRSIPADRVDPAMEGRLVHVSGAATPSADLADRDFGVSVRALKLTRKVEMFQWRETQDSETRTKLGGGTETVTTYKYDKVWSEQAIDSARFHDAARHRNPSMPYAGRTQAAEAKLGAFVLPPSLAGRLPDGDLVPMDRAKAGQAGRALGRPAQALDGVLVLGRDPSAPQVGDLRVSFFATPPQTVSVIARQVGGSFAPHPTRAGDSLEMIEAGAVPADAMFRQAEEENRVFTWILRAVGAVLMFVGFSLILGPLGVVADLIPFLGGIVRAGAGLVGLLCTVALAPLVIGLAWLFYRPLIGLAVLAVGAALVFVVGRLARRRAAAAPVPARA